MSNRTLCFVVPAAGRLELARACFRQLRRTLDALDDVCSPAAVVIGSDENLDLAREQGFDTIRVQADRALGARFNDGLEWARKFKYVMPFGSDDWIDYRLVAAMLERVDGHAQMVCTRRLAVVSEDGRRLARLEIRYAGGIGIRLVPTKLLEPHRYRPLEDHRPRAIDTNLMRALGETVKRPLVADLHPLQIVDFKSPDENLNTYDACRIHWHGARESNDPFGDLATVYPAEAVADVRAVYGAREEMVA